MDNLTSNESTSLRRTATGGDATADASSHNDLLAPSSLVAMALAQESDAHAVAQPDGTLVFVNAAMMEAAGLDARAPRPTNLFLLLDCFRAGDLSDPFGELRAALRAGRAFEREVSCPERGRVFALRVAPITRSASSPSGAAEARERDASDTGAEPRAEAIGLAFAARDVTRLREAERLRGAMLSLVSHELRTPLTSISGFAELLGEDETLPAETREFISIIVGESQRLTRMVNAFLTGARAGQSEDEGELRLAPLLLDEMARETVESLRRAAQEKGVSLVYEDGPRLPPVVADRLVVARAVASLLTEALARSAPGGAITVSASHEAEAVLLCVETGPAAPVEQAALEDAPASEDLTRVAEAAERHGGRLLRETRPAGARFLFTLPRL